MMVTLDFEVYLLFHSCLYPFGQAFEQGDWISPLKRMGREAELVRD